MSKAKGAQRRADISPETLARLNAGELEAATLAEGLAIDFAQLLAAVAPELAHEAKRSVLPNEGIKKRMETSAQLLYDHYGSAAFDRLLVHPSDTVRGWAAYVLAITPQLPLAERLRRARPLANDRHFGVREWAWMALRPHLAQDIEAAIEQLRFWVIEPSENLRRFASESTRPRGVWCTHIARLKQSPELGLPLLEPLRSDPSRYVQDSVANWLNDASKSQPDWVRELCMRWLDESPTTVTQRICTRALRTIGR